MRILFFTLALFAGGCSGQTKEGAVVPIDTLKLFDPRPEPASDLDSLIFKNSLVLFQSYYIVNHDGSQNAFTDLNGVSAYLQANAEAIKQRKFVVLIDSTTSFQKTVSVLDLLKKHKVDNYKVINYQEYFKLPDRGTYQPPTQTTTTVSYDSSYLLITILAHSTELMLMGKKQFAKNSSDIDRFITANESATDPNKIVIMADPNVPFDKFKAVVSVLKKHKYYHYQLISK